MSTLLGSNPTGEANPATAPNPSISSSCAGRSSLACSAFASLYSFRFISPRKSAMTGFCTSCAPSARVATMSTALAVREVGMERKPDTSSIVCAPGVNTFSSASGVSASGSVCEKQPPAGWRYSRSVRKRGWYPRRRGSGTCIHAPCCRPSYPHPPARQPWGDRSG